MNHTNERPQTSRAATELAEPPAATLQRTASSNERTDANAPVLQQNRGQIEPSGMGLH